MVHIINGEIVPDDDPRVRARQQQPQQTQRRFGSVEGVSSSSSTTQVVRPGAGTSAFQNLIRQVGLEGSVTIPAILGFPARPVQKIHLLMAVILTVFFGWRALAFLAFAFFLLTQEPPPRQS